MENWLSAGLALEDLLRLHGGREEDCAELDFPIEAFLPDLALRRTPQREENQSHRAVSQGTAGKLFGHTHVFSGENDLYPLVPCGKLLAQVLCDPERPILSRVASARRSICSRRSVRSCASIGRRPVGVRILRVLFGRYYRARYGLLRLFVLRLRTQSLFPVTAKFLSQPCFTILGSASGIGRIVRCRFTAERTFVPAWISFGSPGIRPALPEK